MKKQIAAILFLSFASFNTAYAVNTVIRSVTGNPVQCNKWGWIYDNVQTVWNTACAPLEVQSKHGILTVSNTGEECKDDEYAVYSFVETDTSIRFLGCYPPVNFKNEKK